MPGGLFCSVINGQPLYIYMYGVPHNQEKFKQNELVKLALIGKK